MQPATFDLLADLALDPGNGWSIGSFGAIGEFVRDADEPATIHRAENLLEIRTDRGGMRLSPAQDLTPIAWDSLSSDGESWGQHFGFCVPQPATPSRVIRDLGIDCEAIRPEDRACRIFDMGVACGAVMMLMRSADPAFIAAMERHVGQNLLSVPEIFAETLRAQPHRILISPAGRIEVYQSVPAADGKSPEGPHTHLIANILSKHRAHGANTPIPDGLQSALNCHPRSPWRSILGERHPFRPEIDAAFAPLLGRFGLAEDAKIEAWLHATLDAGATPESADWPATRRGRTKARILLRRLAAAGDPRVKVWRAIHDRAPMDSSDIEQGEEA